MTDQFKDKVIWVTGASGALGAAVVEHLARAGATVVASSRSIQNNATAFADNGRFQARCRLND
jgi:NAD(P)-dependent dehydrogenase (short-subunit alcohol dehydrogenase family)